MKPKDPHTDRIGLNIFVIQSYLTEIFYALQRVGTLLDEIEKLKGE
uniref:Uncharacterized protein n=1 Tax=viral metagenome TaxID=1070528 RepID=A0A6M3L9P6_9ZZZZ